jgi:hypothetical protein
MAASQRLPFFDSYSPEIEERLVAAGTQESRRLCGAEVELMKAMRLMHRPRAADLRFRCL